MRSIVRPLVCILCAHCIVSVSVFAMSSTTQVAYEGKPITEVAVEGNVWPVGVLDLLNDAPRANGWNPWFMGIVASLLSLMAGLWILSRVGLVVSGGSLLARIRRLVGAVVFLFLLGGGFGVCFGAAGPTTALPAEEQKAVITIHKDGDRKHTLDKFHRGRLLALDDLDPLVREVLEVSDEAQSTSVSKFTAAANIADMEDERVYYHTYCREASASGRYSSKGLQVHNFPRLTLGATMLGGVRQDLMDGIMVDRIRRPESDHVFTIALRRKFMYPVYKFSIRFCQVLINEAIVIVILIVELFLVNIPITIIVHFVAADGHLCPVIDIGILNWLI